MGFSYIPLSAEKGVGPRGLTSCVLSPPRAHKLLTIPPKLLHAQDVLGHLTETSKKPLTFF